MIDIDKLGPLLRRYGPTAPTESLPLIGVRAEGSTLVDSTGQEYLDFSSGGLVPLGYGHPGLAAALRGSTPTPSTPGVFWPEHVELARKLAELTPGGTNRRVLTVDSGREALARAISLARAATGRTGVRYLVERRPRTPLVDDDTAVLVCHPLDPALGDARAACNRNGALLLDDEANLGPGTTGRIFAIEHSAVRPDIYVLGRGWAAGLPFGACITGSSSLRWKEPGVPAARASCAVTLALIRSLEQGLLDQAIRAAGHLARRLTALPRAGVAAGGVGLVWTIAKSSARSTVERCRRQGLLLSLLTDETIGVRPPLTVTAPEIDRASDILAAALAGTGGRR